MKKYLLHVSFQVNKVRFVYFERFFVNTHISSFLSLRSMNKAPDISRELSDLFLYIL